MNRHCGWLDSFAPLLIGDMQLLTVQRVGNYLETFVVHRESSNQNDFLIH